EGEDAVRELSVHEAGGGEGVGDGAMRIISGMKSGRLLSGRIAVPLSIDKTICIFAETGSHQVVHNRFRPRRITTLGIF
ncbi:MAG: hypothetical protein WD768_13435, partial [Phycisphaeraceae bacterium]